MKRMLRKTFEPNREEATRGRRKLHNEGLHDLYSQQNIIHITKSRRMGLGGCLVSWKRENTGFGSKASKKETTRKNLAFIGG
jgi:hypothetical protein